MHKTLLVIASMVTMLASAGMAQADLIAGWDFSQYATAGRLTIDGTTNTNTLDANYSSLDPSLGAGSASALFGSMRMDGTFGSSSINPAPGSDVLPTPRAVVLGNTAPFTGAIQGNGAGFDVFSVLQSEGQAYAQFLGLLANVGSTVVFSANPGALGGTFAGENWSVEFGGETLEGVANVSVALDAGCDGGLDSSATVVPLSTTTGATTQTVTFAGANTSALACVQFAMDSGAGIDNVAVNATPVPEPGTMLMLAAGIGGLVVLRRAKA